MVDNPRLHRPCATSYASQTTTRVGVHRVRRTDSRAPFFDSHAAGASGRIGARRGPIWGLRGAITRPGGVKEGAARGESYLYTVSSK